MDASDRTLPDLVGLLKTWIPWRSDPANVSRDFWMPDQSCRVCYECDSQFTLFNRRHHCRICGRVFCSKCTSNWVPAPSTDPSNPRVNREKVRACNYCFMQWEQALAAAVDNAIQLADLDSVPFSSPNSFISLKSDGNCDTCSNTSMPHSMAGLSSHQSAMTELSRDREGVVTARGNTDHDAADMGICNHSPNRCVFCTTRSEEEEYDAYQLDSERKHLPQVNDYYGHIQFNDIHEDFGSGKVHMDGEAIDTKSVGSFYVHNSIDSQTSEEVQKFVKKEGEPYISDECEASSSLYAAESVSAEPVDFENNGVMWIPPEPEDEEDEKEALLSDDDDDGDAAGEWGNLHASSSFGSGEYRSKDKSNEEQKKVMKNVVDGHFRALIAQLMQVENLPMDEEDERDTWLEKITSLSWEAANLLKPDTSEGGGMDPGGYVKVKCVASGRRSDW
nr:1-phosphatidylinositol-3-phosphate 5-kinase FAB1B-like isoform X1 [Ipomoea batatas]